MLSFAVSLAERKGATLPRGCKSSISVCRAFLATHAGPRAPQEGNADQSGDRRTPSAAMLSYARSLAEQRGITCPPEAETDFDACRRFLDAHATRPQRGSETLSSGAAKTREPAGRGKRRGGAAPTTRKIAARRRA
ncbi:hypothetical protein [Methylobacterium sp. J-070]|uniref:hypothetical protein n=1 Tax=Methylobacterium sp. J-070 TaxID=2836650 RepID=UPI001FBB0F24|nr:hypothetical protein [Methylobacterium sp. J-070]MCJ2052929.1 hypothetical protein [Methylobacterium sp. J-070]